MSRKTECKADFFVVRLPRLSVNKICDLPVTETGLLDYLSSWLASPGVLEAIYLASPSLLERLELWRDKPQSKSGRKVTVALLKYLIRMSSRPTPFGLFSGVATGFFADTTALRPGHLQLDGRKTRLDMFYLATIQQEWAQSPEGQQLLRYAPNSTLYRMGSHLHYIEPYQSASQRQYRLSSVELDEALESMLDVAAEPKLQSEFIQLFCARHPEADQQDVGHYLQQLIQEQVLIADLKLPLTSGQPDKSFVQSLLQAGNQHEGERLQVALTQLATFDQQQAATPQDYQAVVQQLQQLPYKVSENKLFQTDVRRSMTASKLDSSLQMALERTLLTLKAQTTTADNPLQEFINQFQQRFEGRFVRLLQLLDDETGITFSADTGYETPLLAGINIANRNRPGKKPSQSALELQMFKAMQQQANTAAIQLSSDDLLKNVDQALLWQQLPAAFAANVSCYQDHDGQLLLHYHGYSGPSGANLLGRFCHLDQQLQQQVSAYLAAEEALSPDVVFAEVVHMPDGRPGNVIARPALRQYEIVFLADTELPAERQIPVRDLYVFVEAGQVKLWSKRLNKQVIPRLTSAHNYSSRSLGIYRFLCMLQHQQAQLPRYSTPAALLPLERQPRVMLEHVILQEAQWQVERSLLEALLVNDNWQAEAFQALELRYQLPRYVCYAVSDNVLTVDLHHPVMIAMLLAETTGQQQILLKESLIMQYQSVVFNDEGAFAHEIIVPMLNPQAKPFVTLQQHPAKQLDPTIQRDFAPGSEWLSLKIYAAQSTAEQVLTQSIAPLLQQCQRQGWVQQWFFIRYGDPDWHVRLRLFGEPSVLYGQVLPLLHQQLASWLVSQRVRKIELFTYQREVERYGGDEAVILAEQLFQADSEFVLAGLALITEHGESVRWRMALLGADALLDVFDYDAAQKLNLISELRQRFGQEFQEHAYLRTQLGKKYRDYQGQLQQDFQALLSGTDEQPRHQMLVLRQQLIQQLRPVVQQIVALQQQQKLSCTLDTLLHSLLHMFNNRMFKAYGREQEFVVYDFLRRYYLACQSKQRHEKV
ncbi:lantibiotic dehydratase [Rheinheimera riviphila]|uniref:Lantibiotic dehydratase n=1 Tax=Rheinheimera riviphila TaxID=1834037 RepID=A0A437R4T2_9GAMM|nr:lantibiotic dehydratase [Rheinheimera riviphila]RVU41790.1 lantibiotic dehydratase [Rheinheimera riviphila]